jgi:hypothetical protein
MNLHLLRVERTEGIFFLHSMIILGLDGLMMVNVMITH